MQECKQLFEFHINAWFLDDEDRWMTQPYGFDLAELKTILARDFEIMAIRPGHVPCASIGVFMGKANVERGG